ncbi:MAG: VWA domain-containing protein [Betaproteobacteria bacterium]
MSARLAVEAWWPLLALALALPLVWLAWRRSRAGLAQGRMAPLLLLRVAALACVAVALMRPTWLAPSAQVSVVYALDVSRSVAPSFQAAALEWMAAADAAGRPVRSRVLAFSDRARFADSPGARLRTPLTDRLGPAAGADDPLARSVTNLEAALDGAWLGLEPNAVKRVVLMTDGNATAGDTWRAVERLRREGVRVFTVPALVSAGTDAWVEGLDLPADARRDEPVLATVRVYSQSRQLARVWIARGSRDIASQQVTLAPGLNRVALTVKLSEAGPVPLTARVQPRPAATQSAAQPAAAGVTQTVTVGERPRVLLVQGSAAAGGALPEVLRKQGLEVAQAAPGELPREVAGFAGRDVVVLDDVAARDVAPESMTALETWVREQGGGVLFVAGPNTYGESGWRESALERVLPVTFEAREKRRDLALLIVLDRSYSMKGRKLDLAKAATLGALDLLDENHRFGVITFDAQPDMTVPLAPVRSKRRAEDLISRFTASGQTNIYPALQTAYRVLADQKEVRSRHVILLSDGDTQPADFQRLVKRMADNGITVTTVAIGGEADKALLENISKWGNGRFYFTESAERVPKIFIEETQRLVNESFVEEPARAVPRRQAELLRGIDFDSAPPLKGYASLKAREAAEVTLSTETGAPLLARWQVGLGRGAVFASDAGNRWAADWRSWKGFAPFWSQLAREVMRRERSETGVLEVMREGGVVKVSLSALRADGAFRDGLEPTVRVRSPGAPPRVLRLRQTGPGRYEVRLADDPAAAGAARVELLAGGGVDAGLVRAAGVRDLQPPVDAEDRLMPPDRALLQAIADHTGGRYAPKPAEVFDPMGDTVRLNRPLWPWLAALGLLLWLADLALRRAPWGGRR